MPSVAVLAIVALVFACGDDDAGVARDASTRSSEVFRGAPAEEGAVGELVYLVPDPLPAGAEVMSASTSPGPTESGEGSMVLIGRPVENGYSDVIRVMVTPATEGEDPSTYDGVTRVDVDGVDAYRSDHPVTGSYVAWLDESRAVSVSGRAGAGDLVLEVARDVDVLQNGEVRLEELPDGYVEVDSFSYNSDVAAPNWSLSLELDGDQQGSLSISGSVVPAGTPLSMSAVGDRLEYLSVRGADAVTAERSVRYPGTQTETTFRTVAWFERPGMVVSIRSTRSIDEMLAVARSLEEVDEDTFEALGPDGHGEPPEPTPTTVP